MNKQDFSSATIGQKLWCIQLGDCYVREHNNNFITCESKDRTSIMHFYQDGFQELNDAFPSLFWSNPNIVIPEKPKKWVTKEFELRGNRYGNQIIIELSEELRHQLLNRFSVDTIIKFDVEE